MDSLFPNILDEEHFPHYTRGLSAYDDLKREALWLLHKAHTRPSTPYTRMSHLPTSAELTLKRNWILGGYSSEFSLSISLSPDQISDILDCATRALRTHICQDGEFRDLSNLKGRDPLEPLLLTGAPPPASEELFAVGGRIATGAEHDQFTWEPFHYSCSTRFARFEGARTIIHSAHTTRTPTIPEWLPWWLLGAAAPIEPSFFRLGLEFFTSRFVITRLSFVPIVTDTFLLEVVGTTLSCKLKIERPYWKPTNPFEAIPLLRELSDGLLRVCGISLLETFHHELTAKARF